MHELSVALGILDVVSDEAVRHSGRVAVIHVKIGSMAGVVKEALLSAFGLAREGTPFAHAELSVEEVPLVAYCPQCAVERDLPALMLCCPACGGPTPDVVRGQELEVVALEVET